MEKLILKVKGMTCGHCEAKVVKALKSDKGVFKAEASHSQGKVTIHYESQKTSPEKLKQLITSAGYEVKGEFSGKEHPVGQVLATLGTVLLVLLLINALTGFSFIYNIPKIDSSLSLFALFAVGLLTGVHCIAMCGGINLAAVNTSSNSSSSSSIRAPLLYNLGRVISYTVIGGIVGGLGQVIAVSDSVKALIMFLAAVVMILMSLAMLGWLPFRFTPKMPMFISSKAARLGIGKGPFVIGLLNGFMPCGPLQAMQIYALSTGSIFLGALSMMLFSLGTVPLMLGAGFIFSFLKGYKKLMMIRISAVLIVIISILMITNSMALAGINLPKLPKASLGGCCAPGTNKPGTNNPDGNLNADGYIIAEMKDGYQEVSGDLTTRDYPMILVQKDIPVKFNIRATKNDITGCNATVNFPYYDIERELQPGDNIFEFTPTETGDNPYSCWMGMIYSNVKVVDDITAYK